MIINYYVIHTPGQRRCRSQPLDHCDEDACNTKVRMDRWLLITDAFPRKANLERSDFFRNPNILRTAT